MTEFRSTPTPRDCRSVQRLVAETGVFSAIETGWAVEIIETALARGDAAGYHFLFADGPEGLEGYTCFGPIDGTANRFDLYWIAVSPAAQGKGLGRRLLEASEHAARKAGGTHMFIDTSTRGDYDAAHALYKAAGYALMGVLTDFYSDGDSKAIFGRRL